MDSNDPDHQTYKSSPEMLSDSSFSSDSLDISDIFEDPVVHPRVGDEYQAEIPPLLSDSELLQLKVNPAESENISDSSRSFVMGLPIPVMPVYSHANSIQNDSQKSENIAFSEGYFGVPGLATGTWSDFEAECFLAGLYIFGKNLLQVKKFMETKEMGQILSYYYGQFYQSAVYRKWAECRKVKNRKCIVGHRFFTGYRQQELFARLLPRLSEESKIKITEASRAFAEGSISLDECASKLKAMVGIHALVEAIAIGKGKGDLTTLVVDSKTTQMFSHRPEIPSGKAYSSLTCAEIVKYLTGDIRLSKTRSNDLFWEAVWPRLLARGWHSEQPRVDVYAGSKNGLVFLIPGIKKFSRRKLTKGEDYFDSVSDVLAKIASEPELLELEADESKMDGSAKEENGSTVEVNSEDKSDDERHCYLKPRVSAGLLTNLTMFTVVDTSLVDGENPLKVRELRCLPLDSKRSSDNSNQLRKPEIDSNGEATILPNGHQSSDIGPSLNHEPKAIEHQYIHRIDPDLPNCSETVTKKQKLACLDSMTLVLALPAVTSKNSVLPISNQEQVKVTEKDGENFPENRANPQPQKMFDLNLPLSETETGEQPMLEEEEVKSNTTNSKDPSDGHIDLSKDTPVTPESMGPAKKDTQVSDKQPRRQSTRNRPLTTKALEALEIGFLNPVRNSRKRSPSTTTTQDQKQPKRCNAKTDKLGNPPIGNIPAELSGLSKASCPPEAAA